MCRRHLELSAVPRAVAGIGGYRGCMLARAYPQAVPPATSITLELSPLSVDSVCAVHPPAENLCGANCATTRSERLGHLRRTLPESVPPHARARERSQCACVILARMTQQAAPAKPSASVVVVRDTPDALEVLLLRRNEQIAFHGGSWVFPGGRVDQSDRTGESDTELDVARRAGMRETREETGLDLHVDSMLPFAHWTTPVDLPKRFATWFFVATARDTSEVRIDNSEIVDFRWLAPEMALQRHVAGDLTLPAPTFVTLLGMRGMQSVAALMAHLHGAEVQHFMPRLVPLEGGRCTLYREDAGYENAEFDTPGPRHRLIMKGTDWQYIRDF
jgi:8-oxo-dGTP pyrophosphatase MutT (NUDIX family)